MLRAMTDTAEKSVPGPTSSGVPTAGSTVPTFRHFIAGEWVESTSGETFESVNPADRRDVIGRFQAGTKADVAMAVRAAEMAWPRWKATPAPKRGEILYAFGRAGGATTRNGSRGR